MRFSTKLIAGLATAGFAHGALTGASAGELADACVTQLEAEGRDTSGCSCLEEAVAADVSLQEEFLALGEISDPDQRYASASDDAKAAMDSCTR